MYSFTPMLWLLCLMLITPLYNLNAADEYISKQAAYHLLKLNKDKKVLALPNGEREVLLARLELEHHHLDAALAWLSSDIIHSNPLAALLKGEAFRRKSLAAALRAGHYAHAAYDDIKVLRNAELTPALHEADKHLRAFMRIDKAPKTMQKHPTFILTDATHDSIKKAVQSWLNDWQSLNHKAYMSHYDTAFQAKNYNYQSWSQHKKHINQKKTSIHITITDLTMRADNHPQGEGMIVSFQQAYQSNNYTSLDHKELYLLRRNKTSPWLIIAEGNNIHPHH